MTTEDAKRLRKLVKEGNYSKIYEIYGQKKYLNVTTLSYKMKEIDSLLNDGRFNEFYEKYGESIYMGYIKRMMKADIENELGIKPGFVNCLFFENLRKPLNFVRKSIFNVGFCALFSPLFLLGGSNSIIKENNVLYAEVLDEYNNEIEAYASYINSLGLTDLEIIVKVINDMWTNIEGYKECDNYDTIGHTRLGLYNDGYGVCRNMADDFTARMNAINKDYEACNINVYIDEFDINNTKRTILEDNETVSDDLNTTSSIDIGKVFGNHMVTAITLKEDNVILIVDATNPSIGILNNGKIYMLSKAIDGLDIKEFGNTILGYEGYLEYQKKIYKSYINKFEYEKLNDKYGIDRQNEVLNNVIEEYDEDYYRIRK